MWTYIISNKEWIFSGIGIFILTLIITYFSRNKKSKKSIKQLKKASFENSTFNNINGDTVNFNQTIVNELKEKIIAKEKSTPVFALRDTELAKVKKDFIDNKSRLRTNIYAALASAKIQNIEMNIEIRHILDQVEDLLGTNHNDTLNELKEMKDEGLIQFKLKENEDTLSPYTKIVITSKFYSTIIDI